MNFCDVIDQVKPMNAKSIDHAVFMEVIFADLIHPCPYSEIKVVNGSRLHLNHTLPIGKYKTVTTILDPSDDKIFEVIYYEEIFN